MFVIYELLFTSEVFVLSANVELDARVSERLLTKIYVANIAHITSNIS